MGRWIVREGASRGPRCGRKSGPVSICFHDLLGQKPKGRSVRPGDNGAERLSGPGHGHESLPGATGSFVS